MSLAAVTVSGFCAMEKVTLVVSFQAPMPVTVAVAVFTPALVLAAYSTV